MCKYICNKEMQGFTTASSHKIPNLCVRGGDHLVSQKVEREDAKWILQGKREGGQRESGQEARERRKWTSL